MTAAVGSYPPAPVVPPPSLIREMPPEERPRQRLLRSGGEAAVVLAALELARRLVRSEVPRRQPLGDPIRVVRYLALRYGLRDQEVVGALYLDVRNRLIVEEEVFRGALTRTTGGSRCGSGSPGDGRRRLGSSPGRGAASTDLLMLAFDK